MLQRAFVNFQRFFGFRNKTRLTIKQATIIIFQPYEVCNIAKPHGLILEFPQPKLPIDAQRN